MVKSVSPIILPIVVTYYTYITKQFHQMRQSVGIEHSLYLRVVSCQNVRQCPGCFLFDCFCWVREQSHQPWYNTCSNHSISLRKTNLMYQNLVLKAQVYLKFIENLVSLSVNKVNYFKNFRFMKLLFEKIAYAYTHWLNYSTIFTKQNRENGQPRINSPWKFWVYFTEKN